MIQEKLKTWAGRWGPALIMMAVIFTASSFTKARIPEFGLWDFIVKKGGHVLAYGLLAAAYVHGLANGRKAGRGQALLAIGLAALYGATDEYHQLFVTGRGAAAADVVIDTLGAAIGAAIRVKSLSWSWSSKL